MIAQPNQQKTLFQNQDSKQWEPAKIVKVIIYAL